MQHPVSHEANNPLAPPPRLNGAKCRFCSLKSRQTKGSESLEIVVVSHFIAYIFARTEWRLEQHCKIKNNNLSFWVGELMSLWVYELLSSLDTFVSCWVIVSLKDRELICPALVYERSIYLVSVSHKDNKLHSIYRNGFSAKPSYVQKGCHWISTSCLF